MKHDIELQPRFTQIQSKDQAITEKLHSLADSLLQTKNGQYGLSLENSTLQELKANLDKQTQLHAVLSKLLESRLSTLQEMAGELNLAINTAISALKKPNLELNKMLLDLAVTMQDALRESNIQKASEVLSLIKAKCPKRDLNFYFVRKEITGIEKVQSMACSVQDIADIADVAKELSEQGALIIAASERDTLSRDHMPVSSSSSDSLSSRASSSFSGRSSPAFFLSASFDDGCNVAAVEMKKVNGSSQ